MSDINWEALAEKALGGFTTAHLPPTLELPALPHAAMLFAEKANDPEIPVAELAGIVETDSGLTAELLKFVNSSFMGLRSQVKTVAHALSLLGRRQSRMHIISTATQAAVRARKSRLINQATFWSSSLQKALFARELAKLLKTDTDLAFAGAMLQDYLLPVISNTFFEDYLDFVSHREEIPLTLPEYEQQKRRWDHALAAASLAYRWKFPADLVCCLLYHHYGLKILGHPELGRTAVAAVALSALLPDELRQHRNGLHQLARLGQKWKAFDLERLAATVDQQHEEVGLVKSGFPLSELCRPVLAEVMTSA